MTPPCSTQPSVMNKGNKSMQSCNVREKLCGRSDMLPGVDARNSTFLPTYIVVQLKVTLVGPLNVLSLRTKYYLMAKMLSKA